MLQAKKCKYCHQFFEPNNTCQLYCSNACSRKYHHIKTSKKLKKTYYQNQKFPDWICQNPKCRYKFQLDFFPLKENSKIDFIKCPKCGYIPHKPKTAV